MILETKWKVLKMVRNILETDVKNMEETIEFKVERVSP